MEVARHPRAGARSVHGKRGVRGDVGADAAGTRRGLTHLVHARVHTRIRATGTTIALDVRSSPIARIARAARLGVAPFVVSLCAGHPNGSARFGMRYVVLAGVGLLLAIGRGAASRAAVPIPVCGPGQWVLAGAPIGAVPAGSTVQTLVLDAAGRIGLPGACPAIAAKLKGTKKGTKVKAAWPADLCGGVGGKAKLVATIDPACGSVVGQFKGGGLRVDFTGARSPCDVGLVDTGGAPRCASPVVATGSASVHVALDDHGCLSSDVTLATETGVGAKLVAGSCLATLQKKQLRGDVELALDDAGGATGGSGVGAVVRLLVRPKGKGAPLVAAIDPPADVTLPLADAALPGTWFTTAFFAGNDFTTTLRDAELVLLDAVSLVVQGPEHVALGEAGPLGFAFEATAPAQTAGVRTAIHTVSLAIPAQPNLPDPHVVIWKLILPGTGEIVMSSLAAVELGVGDSETKTRGSHTFTGTLLEANGARRFEVTTDVSNRFVIELGLRDPITGEEEVIRGDATGGCAEDACLADTFVGFVRVDARVKNIGEVVLLRDTLAALVPPGVRVPVHRFGTLAGGGMDATLGLFDLEKSVRAFAAQLPGSWAVSTRDRVLEVNTHPANVLGEWRGTFSEDSGGFHLGCPPEDPLCARLTVQSTPSGLRVAYCNGVETQCDASAASMQCALLFAGNPTPTGFSVLGVDNNPPCCIGCPGQQRVYGCELDATVTADSHGQQTLTAAFHGAVTFCPVDPASFPAVQQLTMCRPKPCRVP